ncbi:MAG: PTS fructose transporter subunit EIIBC, partial [Deinococcus sp.]|nr:PTS fructose transporter subunit EIIBC [Deinococcus sp.]
MAQIAAWIDPTGRMTHTLAAAALRQAADAGGHTLTVLDSPPQSRPASTDLLLWAAEQAPLPGAVHTTPEDLIRDAAGVLSRAGLSGGVAAPTIHAPTVHTSTVQTVSAAVPSAAPVSA